MMGSPSTDDIKNCVSYLEETYGDSLQHYTTTNAALDIKAAISLTADKDAVVNVYGVSYGSYWAQRYMIVAPDQADRITLDGICPPDVCRLGDYYDVNTNIAGSDFMTLCGEESKECRDNLGEFPMESLAMVMELAQSERDDCTNKLNITASALRGAFASLLFSEEQRVLIGPLVRRLMRCNSEDMQEINNFVEYFAEAASNQSNSNMSLFFNPLLQMNIALSEMYAMKSPPRSEKYYTDLDKTLFFSAGVSTSLAHTYPYWNKYDPSLTKGYNEYPTSKTALLLLNGELDPQTSHAWFDHTKEHYKSPNQHFVSIPYAVHGTSFFSPVTGSPIACGTTILANFFVTGEIVTKCLSSLEKIDFSGITQPTKDLSMQVFGSPKLW
eukprot:CAMPEP_0174275892 /NCGR_PEP_ID=MMETSP0439-20130205/60087_1 /TAXON_ID=0 /ORGANISM="Stereomyxa ramosa, Strain Chinc5" /LENGTH=383 /DNA_ID=CAMNT_0015368065 /DNA_START=813 /DNA_END=1961 /DNA_ORIENTATION=-